MLFTGQILKPDLSGPESREHGRMPWKNADFTRCRRGGYPQARAGIDATTDVGDFHQEAEGRVSHQDSALCLLRAKPACWIASSMMGTAFSAEIRSVLRIRSKFLA